MQYPNPCIVGITGKSFSADINRKSPIYAALNLGLLFVFSDKVLIFEFLIFLFVSAFRITLLFFSPLPLELALQFRVLGDEGSHLHLHILKFVNYILGNEAVVFAESFNNWFSDSQQYIVRVDLWKFGENRHKMSCC